MKIVPITLKLAQEFIAAHHRHNKPPVGWKFGIGLLDDKSRLVGVATAGRPVAHNFDNGMTLEVNRTCTDGTRNANSMLYGAVWKVAKAMGYKRAITYTQADETGASLRAVGWVRVKDIPPRGSWYDSSVKRKEGRDPVGTGGVARTLWEIRVGGRTMTTATGEILDKIPTGRGGPRANSGAKSKHVAEAVDQAYIDTKQADARLVKAKADREELKFLQESGEWIPRDEVRTQTATAYSAISQTMRSIPDNIERKYALPPEALDEISRIIDEALDGLADTMETMVEKEYPV